MYVSIEVLSDESRDVLLIPATAVLFAPYGDSVFVIEQKKGGDGKASAVAHQKFVRLGERRGDFVAVASGLSPGDVVVSSGAFKLRNGAPVVVNDALKPDSKLAPKPTDQ
jgi:membrane fusion protein (multidrug efflux system)